MGRRLVIILGPTAVGKTDFSIETALGYGSPVISCDSRQIYKEMRIGTAVPSEEQLAAVPHHFIQCTSVTEPWDAGKYASEALSLIGRLFDKGHETLVMCGGSMFYIDAVCNGLDEFPDVDPKVRESLNETYSQEGLEPLVRRLSELDPATAASIDLSNRARVIRALEVCISSGRPFSSFKTGKQVKRDFEIEKIGLSRPREELYSRIDRRVLKMMEEGLEHEVRSLLPYRNETALQTVGYKEMFDCLDGKTSLDEAVALIQQHTRNYAKRQLTWWRRDRDIRWL